MVWSGPTRGERTDFLSLHETNTGTTVALSYFYKSCRDAITPCSLHLLTKV